MSSPSDLKPSEVLSMAADLIEPRGAWTQGYYARDEGGEQVEAEEPKAICWCAIGAMAHAIGREIATFDPVSRAEGYLIDAIGYHSIITWNDAPERTQADVVTAFRKAAELAREDEAAEGPAQSPAPA